MDKCLMPVKELYVYRHTLVGMLEGELARRATTTEVMYLDELMAWHACSCDPCREYMRQVRIHASSVKKPASRVQDTADPFTQTHSKDSVII